MRKIEIVIPEEMCGFLLNEFKYVTERVTLYYDMNEGFGNSPEFREMRCTVAYHDGDRPEVLNSEKPLANECKEIMYDQVISDLFNTYLLLVVMMHKPLKDEKYKAILEHCSKRKDFNITKMMATEEGFVIKD